MLQESKIPFIKKMGIKNKYSKLKGKLKKYKPAFKKGKKYARRVSANIEDYFEENRKQALRMKPNTSRIRF